MATLFVTTDCKVYAMGANQDRQCAINTNITFIQTPTFIETLYRIDPRIRFIATGIFHSMMASDRHVYGVGFNRDGRTGHKPSRRECSLSPIEYFEDLFQQKNDLKVNALACMNYSGVVLLSDGSVHVTGERNSEPFRLPIPVPVMEVVAMVFC